MEYKSGDILWEADVDGLGDEPHKVAPEDVLSRGMVVIFDGVPHLVYENGSEAELKHDCGELRGIYAHPIVDAGRHRRTRRDALIALAVVERDYGQKCLANAAALERMASEVKD